MSDTRMRRDSTPYLTSLDGSAAERVTAMEWGRHLGGAFGAAGALDALRYYEDVGWIGENVKRAMADYVRGLPIDALEADPDYEVDLSEELADLEDTPFAVHARSLEYVAAIANDNITHQLATISGAAAMKEAAVAAGEPLDADDVPDPAAAAEAEDVVEDGGEDED